MAARVHRPLKVIAFNSNGIRRRRCDLSKQLPDLHIDVVVLSETHLKPHERFFIPDYHFYWTRRFPGRKGIPHNHVGLGYMCDNYT
jgi:exonuclease III